MKLISFIAGLVLIKDKSIPNETNPNQYEEQIISNYCYIMKAVKFEGQH